MALRTLKFSILFILIIGCKTIKQSDSESKKDSVRIEVQKIILPAVHDTITIENPCDSNGILLPFKERFSAGQGKVSVEAKKGKVKVYIKLKEYVTKDSIVYRYKYINKTQFVKEEKKWRFELLLVLVLGLLILLFSSKI